MSLGTILKKAIVYPLAGLGVLGGILTGHFFTLETYSGIIQRPLGRLVSQVDRGEEVSLLARPFAARIRKLSLPSLEQRLEQAHREVEKGSFNFTILDKDGQMFYSEQNLARKVPSSEISPFMFTALQANEDKLFEKHYGWNTFAFLKAFGEYLYTGELRGASTITIQLADFLLPDEKSKWRDKEKELPLAAAIEHRYSKQEIITHYLNLAPFGNATFGNTKEFRSIFGVEAAAQYYFHKPAKELNLAESAALVATLPFKDLAEKAYDDFRSLTPDELGQQKMDRLNKYEDLVSRSKKVLGQIRRLEEMTGKKLVTDEEYYAALKYFNDCKLPFDDNRNCAGPGFNHCDFVRLVRRQVRNLDTELGLDKSHNYTIHTEFNPELQKFIRERFRPRLDKIRAKFPPKVQNDINGVVMVVNLKTNSLEAMEESSEKGVLKRYAPGSTFKPFILAAALSDGKTLETTYLDARPKIELVNGRIWSPQNFHDRYTYAPMSLQRALVTSTNSVFASLTDDLLKEKGEEYLKENLRHFGFNFSDFYPAYSLGSKELSLLELVSAYSLFYTGGKSYRFGDGSFTIRAITKVQTENSLWENYWNDQQALAPTVARDIDRSLRAVVQEGTGKKANVPGLEIRGKTGTGKASINFIGYDPGLQRLVGVLFAADQPEAVGRFPSDITAGDYAAPLFAEIMQYLRANFSSKNSLREGN